MLSTINFDSVADIYDYYVNTNLDVDFFANECSKTRGKILELMCGTGRLSVPLLQKGHKLTCIDYMDRMLDVFRAKIKNSSYDVKILKMDVTELSLNNKYNLIILPFNSFSEIVDTEKQYSALKRIYEHLNNEGKFICTLHNPVKRLKTADGKIYKIGEFNINKNQVLYVSYENSYDTKSGIVSGKQFYKIFDNEKNIIEERILDINFRLFSRNEFESMFKQSGFKIENLYGNYDYSDFKEDESPFMIWILKK